MRDLPVKGIDILWKVRRIIGGFNESGRQIGSGVGKMADESTIAIQFHTNPKGYLTYYSYIISKTETLGIDIKNTPCYRLGTMLNSDTKNGKEAMKT